VSGLTSEKTFTRTHSWSGAEENVIRLIVPGSSASSFFCAACMAGSNQAVPIASVSMRTPSSFSPLLISSPSKS
jgi:hypothetical protein